MAKARKNARTTVKDSAHKIWLAGLGALAVAEDQGGKLFKQLVDRGEEYESELSGGVDRATRKMREEAGKARHRAGKLWDRLEGGVDEAVSSALHRLGMPTREEIGHLTRRVEELTRSLENLRGPAKRKKTARKTTARGTKTTKRKAAKKATRRKSASRS